jgi:hypothetical protein
LPWPGLPASTHAGRPPSRSPLPSPSLSKGRRKGNNPFCTEPPASFPFPLEPPPPSLFSLSPFFQLDPTL